MSAKKIIRAYMALVVMATCFLGLSQNTELSRQLANVLDRGKANLLENLISKEEGEKNITALSFRIRPLGERFYLQKEEQNVKVFQIKALFDNQKSDLEFGLKGNEGLELAGARLEDDFGKEKFAGLIKSDKIRFQGVEGRENLNLRLLFKANFEIGDILTVEDFAGDYVNIVRINSLE